MIQSRFQKQHADKHPQHPENGGSGPKPMPASRDATSNIRANGGRAADAHTRVAADSLRREGAAWTKVAADDQRKNPDDPMPHAAFGAEYTARYGKSKMDDANELDARTANAEKTKRDLGLRSEDEEISESANQSADMDDLVRERSLFRGRTTPEELKEHLPLLRGRTRGQKPSDGDADDKAIGALAADTRSGDSKGAMKRMMDFSREQVMRGKKK